MLLNIGYTINKLNIDLNARKIDWQRIDEIK